MVRENFIAACEKEAMLLSQRLIALVPMLRRERIDDAMEHVRLLFYAIRDLEENVRKLNPLISEVPAFVWCRNCEASVCYSLRGLELICNQCRNTVATFHERLTEFETPKENISA